MIMTLHARDAFFMPERTALVAHAAFPKGNVYMTMRDKVSLWYKDSKFAPLFVSNQGRPAESPGHLSLATLMQFSEGLTDRQAAEAVGDRITWKYGMGLELTDPGFHYSILSDHRARLIAGGAERLLFDDMLGRFRELGLVKARGKQRTDSTHVLAAIRGLNRLECIGETLRHTLNTLAAVVPHWLQGQVSPDWFDLYGPRFEQYRLPKGKQERRILAERMGVDGHHLLSAVYESSSHAWLREIPAVETLRQVWVQQFMIDGGEVRLREAGNLPPAAQMIQSPYDVEAHYSRKRETSWTGYKVHLTETCDEGMPHLITNVETTASTEPDKKMMSTIHTHLAERDLLPDEHFVDAGYVDVDELLTSQNEHGIDLVGAVQGDSSWQARAGEGFAAACFVVDWEAETVTCPQGKKSRVWRPRQDSYGNDTIEVRFARQDCTPCKVRSQCTRSKNRSRTLQMKPRAQHIALEAAREYQKTDEFRERCKKRAGVEGTISQGTRCFELRRSRYVGQAKTSLHHLLIAAAMNLTRVVAYLEGRPCATTRRSRFATLASVT